MLCLCYHIYVLLCFCCVLICLAMICSVLLWFCYGVSMLFYVVIVTIQSLRPEGQQARKDSNLFAKVFGILLRTDLRDGRTNLNQKKPPKHKEVQQRNIIAKHGKNIAKTQQPYSKTQQTIVRCSKTMHKIKSQQTIPTSQQHVAKHSKYASEYNNT